MCSLGVGPGFSGPLSTLEEELRQAQDLVGEHGRPGSVL